MSIASFLSASQGYIFWIIFIILLISIFIFFFVMFYPKYWSWIFLITSLTISLSIFLPILLSKIYVIKNQELEINLISGLVGGIGGGSLTLIGVLWTLNYTNQKQERKEVLEQLRELKREYLIKIKKCYENIKDYEDSDKIFSLLYQFNNYFLEINQILNNYNHSYFFEYKKEFFTNDKGEMRHYESKYKIKTNDFNNKIFYMDKNNFKEWFLIKNFFEYFEVLYSYFDKKRTVNKKFKVNFYKLLCESIYEKFDKFSFYYFRKNIYQNYSLDTFFYDFIKSNLDSFFNLKKITHESFKNNQDLMFKNKIKYFNEKWTYYAVVNKLENIKNIKTSIATYLSIIKEKNKENKALVWTFLIFNDKENFIVLPYNDEIKKIIAENITKIKNNFKIKFKENSEK